MAPGLPQEAPRRTGPAPVVYPELREGGVAERWPPECGLGGNPTSAPRGACGPWSPCPYGEARGTSGSDGVRAWGLTREAGTPRTQTRTPSPSSARRVVGLCIGPGHTMPVAPHTQEVQKAAVWLVEFIWRRGFLLDRDGFDGGWGQDEDQQGGTGEPGPPPPISSFMSAGRQARQSTG